MKKNEYISISTIKILLYFFFILGWIIPKFTISDINIGVQEIVAILIIFFNFKIEKKFLFFFSIDLFFTLLLLLLGIIYYVKDSDFEGVLIGARTFLFVLTSIGMSSMTLVELDKLLKTVLNFLFIFLLISLFRIFLNIIFNSFDPVNFFYGSDSYRIRAPFENGGASSQVPIGYMIALILTIKNHHLNGVKKLIFILGAIGTTSRASLVSIIFIFGRKINFKKLSAYLTIILLFILSLLFYLKSFSHSDEGNLDGSSNQRLELYLKSVNTLFESPKSLILGFGLSSNILYKKTGDGFYESFVFNSLMQGGIILSFFSILILLKTLYLDYKYKINSLSIVVLIGNLIGGSNYFSMYAFPIMILLIIIATKVSKS